MSNYSPGPGSADFILDPLKDKNLKSKTIRRRATTILDFGSYSIVLEWNFVKLHSDLRILTQLQLVGVGVDFVFPLEEEEE